MKFKSSHTINQRIEQISMNHIVIGIDIAKETHVAGAVNFRGIQLGRTLSFSNDRIGFEKLIRWVTDLKKLHGLSEVIYGAESTGHYFLNLACWLNEYGDRVVLVNPLTTKRNKENRDNKPSKSDAKDAIIIADAISRGYYSDWVIPDTMYAKLRCLVNEREALACDLTALGNQLQTALDHVFPEINTVFKDWKSIRAFATFKAFVLPADLKSLSVEQVICGWRGAGMKRPGGSLGRQFASSLLAAARRSVGLIDTAQEIKRQIGRLIVRYESIQAHMETIDQELQEQLLHIPQSAIKPLQDIGLSPLFISIILANAVDLSRFAHGRQLLALAGLGLAESSSGKRKGQIVLSKRGRRQLRKYLYLAVIGLVSNHEAFKRWHSHNVQTLKMKKQHSIFKLIGKLARILVGLARSQEAFDAHKANPLLPKAA